MTDKQIIDNLTEQLKQTEAQCEDMFVKHTDLEMKYKRKEQECEELKEQLDKELQWHKSADEIDMINHEYAYNLKAELQKYKDMEAKGLEEFKDVGGCWGCGIQSLLDEIIKEFQQYKASKQASYETLQKKCNELELESRKFREKLEQTLIEVREIANAIVNGSHFTDDIEGHLKELAKQILQKISEVLKDEEV